MFSIKENIIVRIKGRIYAPSWKDDLYPMQQLK